MPQLNIQSIPLTMLLIDLANPRHDEQPSQRDAIATIALDQGVKLANLAEDIAKNGLNPGDLPLVTPADENGQHIVLEGNRRLTALKLMTSPALISSIGLPQKLNDRFVGLYRDFGSSLPREITCSVLTREAARQWILQKHTGENEGKGIVMWDGPARQRFRGMSPPLQVINLVKESDLIDQETRSKLEKIAITNIQRILDTPDARRELGVDIQKGELVFIEPEEVALGRLALVVADIANKRVKVSDLDYKDQRVAYAKRIANQPLPPLVPQSDSKGGSAPQTGGSKKTASSRNIKPDRKALIPSRLKLIIGQHRINRIYFELRKLDVEEFVNSVAVMFRVFIELSVDQYAQDHSIDLTFISKAKPGEPPSPPKAHHLPKKLELVAQYLEDNKLLTKNELRGIRAMAKKDLNLLSIDTINAYVHNKDFHPVASELKISWDNIQRFVQGLWAE